MCALSTEVMQSGATLCSVIYIYDPTSLDCNAGADPGFTKRGGGCNIFDVAKYIGVLEVEGGGVPCMSTLRHSYRDSVILETEIFVIHEGHLEKKMESIFGNQGLGQEGY